MSDDSRVKIGDVEVHLAEPMLRGGVGSVARDIVGRDGELRLCRAAWDVERCSDESDRSLLVDGDGCEPLSFRLEGPPGVGKNEIVYRLARELDLDLYVLQGHEELTPEDLALVIVPERSEPGSADIPLVLRASPLATALIRGGLVFFDEINRAPERALSPLAPVLDGRRAIYSAVAGIWIRAEEDRPFRFCCAINPSQGCDLPPYLDQRTLPAIRVERQGIAELTPIVRAHVDAPDEVLREFHRWYSRAEISVEVSAREAILLVGYATKLLRLPETDGAAMAFDVARRGVLGDRG